MHDYIVDIYINIGGEEGGGRSSYGRASALHAEGTGIDAQRLQEVL